MNNDIVTYKVKKFDNEEFEVVVGEWDEFTIRGYFSGEIVSESHGIFESMDEIIVEEIEQLLDNGQTYLVTDQSREFDGENFQYFKEKYWSDICEEVSEEAMRRF